MNALTNTYHDWQALSERLQQCDAGWKPQPLTPVKVNITRARLNKTEAMDFLASVSRHSGWLQQPSQLMTLPADEVRIAQQPPLLAEGVAADVSWKLRHLHGDEWQQTLVNYQVLPSAEGATHLAEKVVHLSHHARDAKLHYLRLWVVENQYKPCLEIAILEGFAGGKQ